ncbi:hypothetical protein ADUPG1_005383, partial [Aduncisulcus paluster]
KEHSVFCDASHYGIGAVLLQEGKPVMFIAKKFSDSQLNWTVIEKEAFAIYFALKKIEYLVSGIHFTLFTDHQDLLYLLKAPSAKIIRWSQYIFSFDLEFVQISGKENPIADYLSRLWTPVAIGSKAISLRVVESDEMKDYLLRLHHSPGQVHIPKSTMILAIKKSGYTWRTLEEDADSFCRECLLCQKTTGSPPSNALMGSTLRLKPFETV